MFIFSIMRVNSAIRSGLCAFTITYGTKTVT